MIEEIKAQIDRFYQEVPYGYYGRYRGQDEREDIESAFPETPAVLVEIGRFDFQDQGGSHVGRQQVGNIPITVHIIHVFEDFDDESFDASDDYLEKLGSVLHSLGAHGYVTTPGLGCLRRVAEVPDYNPVDRVVHNMLELEWEFDDATPELIRRGVPVTPTPSTSASY